MFFCIKIYLSFPGTRKPKNYFAINAEKLNLRFVKLLNMNIINGTNTED